MGGKGDEILESSGEPASRNGSARQSIAVALPQVRPQRTASFQDYTRVFTYATKWDFLAYAAGFVTSVGAGVTLPLTNVVFGRLVGNISDFSNADQGIDEFKTKMDRLSLYLFALFIARLGLGYLNTFAFRMIGIRLSSAIRLAYLKALFGQSIHVLDSMPPGLATTTITSTSNVLQLGISEKLGVFVEYNTTIIASIIIAFTRNWSLTLVTLSAILFILISTSILLPFIVKGHGRVTEAESKASSVASESFASIRIIAACGAELRVAKKYAAFVEDAKKHAQFTSPLVATQFGLIFFSIYAAFALAFWYGIKLAVKHGSNNVGTIVTVLFSVMISVFALERISSPLMAVSKATVAACQFFTVIDAPQTDTGRLRDPEISAAEDIVFDKVTFAYPSRPQTRILDELDLRIEAGKITAIVGPSGSGKSTIVGLIERWYGLKDQYVIEKAVEGGKKKSKKDGLEEEDSTNQEPEDLAPPVELSGSITVGGQRLDQIDVKWWRCQIGLVQQEPFLFNDTIYANVANGLIGSPWENAPEERKRELVKEACQEAFAEEFIQRLPDAYETKVGDGGAKLSGGQRQRIAIARSIVRKPRILILDEATSAIDVRGERIVQAALDRVTQNRTTITIAHRLSTIKKADRIVVMKKGKVVESGTHESLIAMQGGVYSGLVNAQALLLGAESQGQDEDEDRLAEKEAEPCPLMREKSSGNATAQILPKEDSTGQLNFLASFGRLLYEAKSHWYLLFLTALWAAGAGAGIPLQAWLFAKIIVIFQYQGEKLLHESNFWALMWLVLAIGVGASYFFTFFFSTRLAPIIQARYQKQYFEDILYQNMSFFDEEDHSQGTMTAQAASDPQKLQELMGVNMASVYIAVFNLTGSVAIAFAFGWKLALVASSVVLPILLASSFWRVKYELEFEKMNNEVFAESSKFASESIGAFRTVASLTLEGPTCDRFAQLCRGHVVTAYKKARWASLLFGLSDSTTLACQALIFWYGSRLLASGEYTIESFFVCFMAVTNAGQSAGQSLSFGPNAAQVTAAANRILKMRDTRLQATGSGSSRIFDAEGGVEIALENLHFKYPTRDVPVFSGLSLRIEKGQFAALVGASGCGKTSIIGLMERFYDLDKGRILCNGQDIALVDVYEYRRHLSLVAQEPMMFQGTLRDNIILGVDETTVTEEQIHRACRDASIHDFIVSLPEGYDTNIGSRGVSLSGGQKQRVAIARALMRNPDVLLLDEATSSLDSESEKLVQAALESAGKGRTMLVVAHRLATIQNADVIFVLGEGKLLEQGSHAELLKKRGVYWQMCQSQALDR